MIVFKRNILLGSGSPRRKQLLSELGFNFRVLISKTAEIPDPDLRKGDIAKYLAEEKSDALKNEMAEDEALITADTIVCIDSSVLNKPADESEAFSMLKLLNGNVHQVYTGVCLRDKSSKHSFITRSDVYFKKISDKEINEYIHLYKPFDKAGAYGAQECLAEGINPCSEKEKLFMKKNNLNNLFKNTSYIANKKRIPIIDHIEGSYFNVMGLPIVELTEALEKLF